MAQHDVRYYIVLDARYPKLLSDLKHCATFLSAKAELKKQLRVIRSQAKYRNNVITVHPSQQSLRATITTADDGRRRQVAKLTVTRNGVVLTTLSIYHVYVLD